MDYPSQGLTFGSFSVDEWEELFGSGARRNCINPPVEFLFEFETEHEDQGKEARGDEARQDGGCKSGPTGPEDSGVEVGQESEQECLPDKPVVSVSAEALAQAACDPGNYRKAKESGADISFVGASIVEDKATQGSNTGPSIPRDAENFPPLGGLQVQDTDRSRRRLRKRKQHQRSGDVPCSSSEDSDRDRSPAGSSERAPRGRSGSGQVNADKGSTAAEVKQSAGATAGHKASVGASKDHHDTSSTDSKSTTETILSIGETSSSPMQSDVDNHSIQTPIHNKSAAATDDKAAAAKPKLEDMAKAGDNKAGDNKGGDNKAGDNKAGDNKGDDNKAGDNKEGNKSKKTGVVKSSWADLFRNTSRPAAVVVSAPPPPSKVEAAPVATTKPEVPAPSVISIDQDKPAVKIAEMLKNATLDNDSKHIFLRGLINRGNWCYINATLQALLACPPFFNLLRQIKPIASRESTSTPILDSLVKFFHEFNIVSRQVNLPPGKSKADFRTGSAFEPIYVYKMLSTIDSTLSLKGRQEDAEEFLSCVLNGIHEEMLQVAKLLQPMSKTEPHDSDVPPSDDPNVLAVKGEDMGDSDDTGDWEQVGPRNKSSITRMATFPTSLISDIFGGFLRSSLHQAGAKESANVEPFFCLQLDIQSVHCIEDALNHLTVKEELQGYTCSKTKAQIDVSRRVSFEGLPKILILHLKRFIYSKNGSQKLQKHVDYPLELTIGKELLSPNVRSKYNMAQKTYKLCAVVYHHGKMASGGHYTANILHPAHGWVHTDDTKLKPVPPGYVLKASQEKDPYLLYYRRTDQII